MKIIDKESFLFGWGRIIAVLAQVGTLAAITMGQPDAAPDLTGIANQGTEIIKDGYALYAQVALIIGSITAAGSKIFALFNKR